MANKGIDYWNQMTPKQPVRIASKTIEPKTKQKDHDIKNTVGQQQTQAGTTLTDIYKNMNKMFTAV